MKKNIAQFCGIKWREKYIFHASLHGVTRRNTPEVAIDAIQIRESSEDIFSTK